MRPIQHLRQFVFRMKVFQKKIATILVNNVVSAIGHNNIYQMLCPEVTSCETLRWSIIICKYIDDKDDCLMLLLNRMTLLAKLQNFNLQKSHPRCRFS